MESLDLNQILTSLGSGAGGAILALIWLSGKMAVLQYRISKIEQLQDKVVTVDNKATAAFREIDKLNGKKEGQE
jgi:hypothetical protein